MNTLLMMLALMVSPAYHQPMAKKVVNARDTIQVKAYRYGYVPYPPDEEKQKTYSDWYGSLYAEDGQIWVFDIICDSTEERGIFPEENKEYTYTDMDPYYTYWMQYEMGPWVPATDAKFKYWHDADGLEHMDATMKLENAKVYHITYVTKTIPESYEDRYDTMRVVRLGDYRDSVDHCFQFTATNDSIKAVFAINSQTIPGTYTKDDIYGELDQFTYLYINDIDRSICDFKVKIENGKKEGEYLIDAEYYCYNGKCYHYKMDYTLPTIEETFHLSSEDMVVTMETFYDVFIQGYRLTASTEDYTFEYQLPAPGGIEGSGVHMTDKQTGKTIDVYQDIITVHNPLYAQAEVLDYDGNHYIVNMRGPRPDSTEVREITIYDAYLTDVTKKDGLFFMEGISPDSLYYFGMLMFNKQVEGTYDQDDADFNYTYVGDYMVDPYGSRVTGGYHMIALDAEVKRVGDDYEVEATFLGQSLGADGVITPLFHIHMTTAGLPTDLINVNANVNANANANANKFMEKGRVIIMNKRTKYDILGSKIN